VFHHLLPHLPHHHEEQKKTEPCIVKPPSPEPTSTIAWTGKTALKKKSPVVKVLITPNKPTNNAWITIDSKKKILETRSSQLQLQTKEPAKAVGPVAKDSLLVKPRVQWNNSVYITGLGNQTDITEADLFKQLSKFGELDSVKIMNKTYDSYAFANFKTPTGMQNCIKRSGEVVIKGRTLNMRPKTAKRSGFAQFNDIQEKTDTVSTKPTTSSSRDDEIYSPALNMRTRTKDVWVGSLPQGVTEVKLLKLISSIGGIKPVRLKPHGNGNTRSVFVEYESITKARTAVTRLNNAECCDTLLRAHMCFKRSPWYIDRALKVEKLQRILKSSFTKRELEKIDDKLRSLWCAGFRLDIRIQTVYESFSKYGEVDMVAIQHDRVTHRRTGSCFVRYRDYKNVFTVLKSYEDRTREFADSSTDHFLKNLTGVNRAFQPSFLDGKAITMGFVYTNGTPTKKYREIVYGEKS